MDATDQLGQSVRIDISAKYDVHRATPSPHPRTAFWRFRADQLNRHGPSMGYRQCQRMRKVLHPQYAYWGRSVIRMSIRERCFGQRRDKEIGIGDAQSWTVLATNPYQELS